MLIAKGEGILPKYKFTPNLSCCRLEAKIGSVDEFKIEIENSNPIKLLLNFRVDFLRKEKNSAANNTTNELINEVNPKTQKQEQKDKKEGEKKSVNWWEVIPGEFLSDLETFEDVNNELADVFSIVTAVVTEKNEVTIPPFGKSQLKIRFGPPISSECEKKKKNNNLYYH